MYKLTAMELQLQPYRSNTKGIIVDEPYNLIGDDFTTNNKMINSKGNRAFRKGQQKYRRELFQEMGGRCIITGISLPVVLNACHIKPYCICNSEQQYDAKNGLIMKSDFHTLFDKNLLSINPETLRTIIIPLDDDFSKYNNKYLSILKNDTARLKYLKDHYAEFCKKNKLK